MQTKNFTFLKVLVILMIVILLTLWLRHEFRVDSCLDRGGRWNSVLSTCEGATEH